MSKPKEIKLKGEVSVSYFPIKVRYADDDINKFHIVDKPENLKNIAFVVLETRVTA